MQTNAGSDSDNGAEILFSLGGVLAARRNRLGLALAEAASRTGIPERRLEDVEAGRQDLSEPELTRLARCLGTTAKRILDEAELVERVQRMPDEPSFDAAHAALSWAADLRRVLMDHARAMALPSARPCAKEAGPERQLAEDSWRRLQPLSPAARKASIGGDPILAYPHFMRWGLAEKLCRESEAVLAEDAAQALELADLALRVAKCVGGSPAWRNHLQGYTWAFIAKAKLVGGDRAGAEEAAATARALWNPSSMEEPDFLKWPEMAGLDSSKEPTARGRSATRGGKRPGPPSE